MTLRYCYPSVMWEILCRAQGLPDQHLWIKFESLAQLTASTQPQECSHGYVGENRLPFNMPRLCDVNRFDLFSVTWIISNR